MYYTMKNHFVVFCLLLLMRRDVSADEEIRLGNDATQTYDENDPFEEKGVKWDIDLDDMLSFDKYGSKTVEIITEEHPTSNTDSQRGEEIIYSKIQMEDENVLWSQIYGYVARYVNLFLTSLDLKNKKLDTNSNRDITINFDFVVSPKDLETLQNLSKNLGKHNILEKLYVIDRIMSKGIYPRYEPSFYEEIVIFLRRSGFSKDYFDFKNPYFVIIGTAFFFMLLLKRRYGFSYKFIAIAMINNMIALEGIFNYYFKLKEATIADHVERLKHKSMEEACYSEYQTLFGKIYQWFAGNECLAYHRSMQMNRADKIFPLESIINAYSFYIIEMPLKILGSGIKTFVANMNDHLPVIVRQFSQILSQYFILFFMLFFALCCFCPEIRFNFWGARIELSLSRWIRHRRRQVEDEGPAEYRRIRDLPRAAIREMEKEYVQPPPDYLEEGSSPVSDVVKDTKTERSQAEEGPVEENNEIEIFDEDVRSDNESVVSEERNLSRDVKTAKRLLAELKTSE